MSEIIRLIVDRGLIAVVNIPDEERLVMSAVSLAEGGIKLLGIPATLEGMAEVVSELSESSELIVGISRVVNKEQVSGAMMAGAQFLLSSIYDEEIVRMARDRGMVVIAGAATPTEVMAAARLSNMVNVFPAPALGGPDYLRTLSEQFPDVPLIASGGVDVDTAPAFLESGAAAVIVDSGLVPDDPDPSAFEVIRARAEVMVEVCAEASKALQRGSLSDQLIAAEAKRSRRIRH